MGRGAYPPKSRSRTQAPQPTVPARGWEGAPAAPPPSSAAPCGWKRVVVSPCGLKCVPREGQRGKQKLRFLMESGPRSFSSRSCRFSCSSETFTRPRVAGTPPGRSPQCGHSGFVLCLCWAPRTRQRTQHEFTPLRTCVSRAVRVSKRTPSTGLIHGQSPRTGRRLHGPGLAHVAPSLLVAMFSLCGHTVRTESFGISGLLEGTLCSCTRRHRERACSRGQQSASARLLQLLNYAAPTSEPRLGPSGEPPVCTADETRYPQHTCLPGCPAPMAPLLCSPSQSHVLPRPNGHSLTTWPALPGAVRLDRKAHPGRPGARPPPGVATPPRSVLHWGQTCSVVWLYPSAPHPSSVIPFDHLI